MKTFVATIKFHPFYAFETEFTFRMEVEATDAIHANTLIVAMLDPKKACEILSVVLKETDEEIAHARLVCKKHYSLG